MTNAFSQVTTQAAAQATALGLAAVVTLGVLLGLDGLASHEFQAAQQAVSAQATQITPSSLPV